MLTLNALSCERDGRALFVPLDLTVSPGDYIEVMGANGVGKSTLLRTLAGLYSQYSGEYETTSFLYQGHRLGLDGLLSPLENLAWFAGLEGQQGDRDSLLSALAETGVLVKAFAPCNTLSAGQQRRTAMARLLVSERTLWLLDEPLTALDVSAQNLLRHILAEHCANGGAVVCATHNPIEVTNKVTVTLQALTEVQRQGAEY
ncbi:MAG: heme ABC exporter ATP-binding protein CcmA [Pseudomonadota bacterium]|nr:heme ABC exporter ATP-binding protein CcmA [Pseudomonadota bacterium]